MSFNSRLKKEVLLPCFFGATLKHPINWTVATQALFPGCWILAVEFDFCHAFQWLQIPFRLRLNFLSQLSIIFFLEECISSPSEGSCWKQSLIQLTLSLGTQGMSASKILPLSHAQHINLLAHSLTLLKNYFNIPVNSLGLANVYINNIAVFCVDLPELGNFDWIAPGVLLATQSRNHRRVLSGCYAIWWQREISWKQRQVQLIGRSSYVGTLTSICSFFCNKK